MAQEEQEKLIEETARKEKRERVIHYIEDSDLISDEAIDVLYELMVGNPNKNELLKMSGFDTSKTYDSAYPEPYANRIREIYPEFNNGWHFFDYSTQPFGEMRNVYNLFAKKMLQIFRPKVQW